MQHLLSAWPEVARRIKAAGRVLLLCDYDGTLTPIVDRPERAELAETTRQLLRALHRLGRFTVAIVTGRALSDIRQRVGIEGIIYAANHGLEIEGPGIRLVHPLAEEVRPVFRLLHQVLSKALGPTRGALVEDKGLTLSVHYRTVDEDRHDEVKSAFERVVATARSLGRIRTTTGKKVLEVRPAVDWDKGRAIALLMERYGRRKAKGELLSVFLGDDLTDEDGFRVIEKHGGISVFVGDATAQSGAGYRLDSPQEVERFLGLLLESAR